MWSKKWISTKLKEEEVIIVGADAEIPTHKILFTKKEEI